ncbi:MAG: bifunctional adenosylcobinamide kinase/adenosylcobinamide-phosphate guanylyltransferase [Eubacteriales bacterium]|nr:bifunctional adenosylcobinamide kinase/adenosylcobinamide-phosphate guanylyltransferase [Eubacteriales bacterium]
MLVLVTGGSGSGKSEYAERQMTGFAGHRRFYIATMECRDAESERRIARHRAMRAGKGFETLECPGDLERLSLDKEADVLLECMSNLVANEMFADGKLHEEKEIADKILKGVKHLLRQSRHVMIVTNEVFSDGAPYDPWTQEYLRCLGRVNRVLAEMADRVVEVVYSIPVERKKEGEHS